MESSPAPRGDGIRCAGELVEVIDRSNKRCGSIGRIVYFVGDNVYVTFGRRFWSAKHMFFPDQLRAVGAAQPVPRRSRLLQRAARLLTLLHLP